MPYEEAPPPLQKTLKDPAPPGRRPVGAVVGAAARPSAVLTSVERLAVNAVGGVLTGTAGFWLGKRLAEEREAAAAPAAQLLAGGLADVTSEKLEVADDHGVPRDEFAKQLGSLYQIFPTSAHVAQGEPPELSELRKLATLLKLSPAQIGDQVYGAGRQLYSRHRAYLEEDERTSEAAPREVHLPAVRRPRPAPRPAPRLALPLTPRPPFHPGAILSGDESEEGYRYEVTRHSASSRLHPPRARPRRGRRRAQYEKVLQHAVSRGAATPGRSRASASRSASPSSAANVSTPTRAPPPRALVSPRACLPARAPPSRPALTRLLLGRSYCASPSSSSATAAPASVPTPASAGAAQAVQLPDAARRRREGLATPLYQKALAEAPPRRPTRRARWRGSRGAARR